MHAHIGDSPCQEPRRELRGRLGAQGQQSGISSLAEPLQTGVASPHVSSDGPSSADSQDLCSQLHLLVRVSLAGKCSVSECDLLKLQLKCDK